MHFAAPVFRFHGTAQEVTTGAASAASSAFGSQTFAIRVSCTVACRIIVGDGTPTALATSAYLPANVIEYIRVSPGQKIAAIQETGAGKLSVTELTH
jgi:hypothetical protein